MSTPFDNLKYGPFEATYHREAVSAEFKARLVSYLTEELLPQVTIDYEETFGSLEAVFDDDLNCGPHSAVKYIYKLTFVFQRGKQTEEIVDEIVYNPVTGAWRPRWPHLLTLQTVERKRDREQLVVEVNKLLNRMQEKKSFSAKCPACGADLQIIDRTDLFDLSCSDGCFNYDFHRDPETGEFRHGHFFINEFRKEDGK